MKIIFLLLFFLSSIPAVLANETCTIDYLQFCERQDPRIPNMCPQLLGHHLKSTCVVTSSQKKVILSTCARELRDICRVATGEDFLGQYICLTNPEKWESFSGDCLKALVKNDPHHYPSKRKAH
jgi:hypothetical protein